MQEKIEVGYSKAAVVGELGVYHKYILYTNSAGKQFYARSGPGYFGPGAKDGGRDEASTSLFGNIKSKTGEYKEGADDWDSAPPNSPDSHARETITTGDDLSGDWKKITDTMKGIDDQNIPYDPRDTNSNASVDEALRNAGLSEPIRDGVYDHWAPGSGYDLPGGESPATQPKSFEEELGDFLKDRIEDGYYNAKEFIENLPDRIGDWYKDLSKLFDDATKVPPPRIFIDPIVLDLDGDGIEMIARQDNNVFFDMDNDGLKDWTGWVNKDDAFLAIDENNNGLIDSIKELIGEQNTSGFTELKGYDSNGDKIFNNKDTLWTAVKVWQDLNTNGISEANELKSLADVGIKSIDLNYTEVEFTAADNQIHEQSVFERTDGTIGYIADVWLNVDRIAGSITNTNTGNSTIDALPDIRGLGDVASLHNAMFSDGALTSLVNAAVSFTIDQIGSLRGTAEQIIYRWAEVQDIATNSRGASFDGRKLAALEKFVGHNFINTVNATNPTAQAAPFLSRAWDELLDSVQARLAIAGTLKGVLPIVYETGADRFISLYDVDQVLSTLKNIQPSDTLQAAKFWGAFLPVISRIVDDAGGNSAAADHVAKVSAALAEMGLDKFQNNLVNGIQLAIPPSSGSFIKNGAYQLSDAAETLSVNGNASQAIYGLGGNDVLTAIAPNAVAFFLLDGGNGNDVLRGSINADWLNGGVGADLMVGGAGDDIYYVDDAGDVVRENRNEGNDSVRSTITYTLGDNVENLELLDADNLNGTGNALANTIIGNAGVNILIGNDGNDNLDGGGNADTLIGGLGNDTYTIDNIADVIVEKFNEGVDTVQSRISFVLVNSLENLVLQGAENINGTGNSGNNNITGNIGNNILNGKTGNDTLKGDAGDDIYWVDSTADKVIEIANGGLDTVNSSASITLGVNVENLTMFGDADINGIGNASNNILLGNAGANTLDGKAGVDAMSGGASDDMYYVDNIADVVTEINDVGIDTVNSSVSFVLGDYIENLTLSGSTAINGTGNNLDNEMIGNTGANNLVGNAGNDVLDGKAGADTLSGGLGDDSYVVDNVADIVTEASNAGKDTVQSSVTWILGANLENLVLSGAAAINATGNELANRLTGNSGKNQLDGKAGADILMGLGGDDVYLVDTKDSIIENFNEGIDTVQSSFNYVLGDNIENLVLLATALNGTGNKLNNTLTGNNKANTLIGNDGNDILDGAAGADILNGGKGNDTYMVDNIADTIIEGWNGGIDKDTVQSSISYTLGKNLENLLLLGTDAINAIGNTSNNILTGNAGNNILDGKAGDDVMKGGAGDDIYYVDSSLDVLSEAASAGTDSVFSNVSYLLGNNVENLTLLGEDDINATGNNLNNTLLGNSGVNTLDGKAGADTLNGGLGDDVYFIDNIGDIIIENADAGVDTVNSTITYTLSNTLENLTLLGAGAINGIGNDMDNILIGTTGNNTLTGNAGNDFLNGGAGADNLNGGMGDDIYVVDNVNDVITEASNAGIDTVQSSLSHILLSNFENLVLIGTVSIDAKGNALGNIITGNTASNVLDGQGGADKLIGLAGNDTYLLDNVNDTVWEDVGGGLDIVKTTFSYVLGENLEQLVLQGSGNLTGTGNDLNNNITGNAGANIINGGNGNDTLTGGAGADIFQLTNAANIDSIIDFSVIDDTLQLDNNVFASLGAEGVLAASKLRVGAGITTAADANDYLIYNSTDGKLYYDADAIGANAAVQIALLGKGLVLTSADFVVI